MSAEYRTRQVQVTREEGHWVSLCDGPGCTAEKPQHEYAGWDRICVHDFKFVDFCPEHAHLVEVVHRWHEWRKQRLTGLSRAKQEAIKKFEREHADIDWSDDFLGDP